MQRLKLSRKDLEPLIGSRSHVSEVLNRKRPLSIRMIRNLSAGLGISAEALIQEYPLVEPESQKLIILRTHPPLNQLTRWLIGNPDQIRRLVAGTFRAWAPMAPALHSSSSAIPVRFCSDSTAACHRSAAESLGFSS